MGIKLFSAILACSARARGRYQNYVQFMIESRLELFLLTSQPLN